MSSMRYDIGAPNYDAFYAQSSQMTNPASSYYGILQQRTGGAITVMLGLSSGTVIPAGGTPIYEDRGDGVRNGLWTFPPYTNDAPTNFASWTSSGTVVRTSGVAGAPDGTSTAYTVQDADAANVAGISASISSGQRVQSIWVRDNAVVPPTAQGMLGGSAGNGAPFGSGSAWRRVVYNDPATAVISVLPAGAQPSSTTPSATGAVDVWAPSSVAFPASSWPGTTDYPSVVGSSGAATLELQLGDVTDGGGDLDVTVNLIHMAGSIDEFVNNTDYYLFSALSPDGLISLRFRQLAGGGSHILAVRGTDVLTAADTSFINGDEDTIRFWYRVSTAQCGIARTLNGSTVIVTGTASGAALSRTSQAWLGSNSGTSGHTAALWRGYIVRRKSDPPIALAPEFLVLGDSISTPRNWGNSPGSNVYLTTERRVRRGIVSLGVSGDTIAGQKSKFDTSQYPGQTTIRAVILEVGINDIWQLNHTASQVISDYQGMVNDVAASLPNAKILVQRIGAARGQISSAQYAVWQTVTQAQMGLGSTPITGVHARIDTSSMADSNDNLLAQYDDGDHLHLNEAGRVQLASLWRGGLHSLGLI